MDARDLRAFAPRSTELTEDAVATVFTRVNAIWQQALIRWEIESILREDALNSDAFAAILRGDRAVSDDVIASVLPRENLLTGDWDVFLILSLGGISCAEPVLTEREKRGSGQSVAGSSPRAPNSEGSSAAYRVPQTGVSTPTSAPNRTTAPS